MNVDRKKSLYSLFMMGKNINEVWWKFIEIWFCSEDQTKSEKFFMERQEIDFFFEKSI